MRCQYLLKNVKFNHNYENTPYFSSASKRNEKLVNDNFNDVFINFDFGDMLTTNCVVNEYNGENYIIIKHGDDLYFYFITDSHYLSVNQWRLHLECDVISQYCVGIAENQSVSKCYIERAHCDRFRVVDNNNVIFNVNNESPIIESETNFDKITKRRHEVKIRYCKDNTMNKWLNDNILCWQYMYIDSKHPFTLTETTSGFAPVIAPQEYQKTYVKRDYLVGNTLLEDEYTLCCVPVYKNKNKINVIDKINRIISQIDSLDAFRNVNNDNEFIYNIKYSITPPFDFNEIVKTYYIQNDSLYINGTCIKSDYNNMFTYIPLGNIHVDSVGTISVTSLEGFDYVLREHSLFTNLNFSSTICEPVNTSNKFVFNRNVIKGQRSVDYEPKILVDCKSVTLRDSSNGAYVYPSLYIGNNLIAPLYNESMNITNNNYYYRVGGVGIIPEADKSNWHGVANTVDFSQQIANDNYANFLSNNKNFLLTKQLEFIPKLTSLARGNISILGDFYNVWQDLDNLQNRPNSMKNVNDSVELNLVVNNGVKLYVDEDEAREVDIYKYYNYLYNYGYKLNRIDYIHNYINTRRYFNYIKCRIEYINVNMPDIVERKIKEIFNRGVRLWNDFENMYNYETENYEKWM